MITKISSTKNGQVVYHFDNGVILSFIWSSGSYTKHHFDSETNDKRRELIRNGDFYGAELLEWESDTVEVYSMGARCGLDEYFEKHYDGNPAGYVPVSEIPKILDMANKWK